MAELTEQDITRFWSKVDRRGAGECWAWLSGKFHNGYGSFYLRGRNIKAHRYAWAATYGDIPAGNHVLHSCDNPPCVNPAHLFLGTDRENVADMMMKGRNNQPSGERHCMAKLSTLEVKEIRDLKGKKTHSEIASHFNISRGYVSKLQNRLVRAGANEQ